MGRIKFNVHYSFIIFGCILVYFGQGFLLINYLLAIVLHELTHAYVARKLGYVAKNITLTPFGMSLSLNTSIVSPKDEIKIAIAGPVCNFVLSLCLLAFWWMFPSTYNYTYLFCYANIVTCLFNLLPVFPLDGGRVFRGAMRNYFGEKKAVQACKIASIIVSVALLLLFVFSLSYNPNYTCLFVLMSIFPIPKGQNYFFINYSQLKKKKDVMKIKSIYIKNTQPLYKACKYIDSFSYLNLCVYDEYGRFVKVVGERELLSLLDSFEATTLLKDTKSVL